MAFARRRFVAALSGSIISFTEAPIMGVGLHSEGRNMSTVPCSERKRELCERAKEFHHTKIYVPGQKGYVAGLVHEPVGMSEYKHGEDEPIVSPRGLYELDTSSSWLTVNGY